MQECHPAIRRDHRMFGGSPGKTEAGIAFENQIVIERKG